MFTKNFDYAYFAEDWEHTFGVDDLQDLEGFIFDGDHYQVAEVCTLIKGPSKWVAIVPVTFDKDGDVYEEETQWFDTREEMEVALKFQPKEQAYGS